MKKSIALLLVISSFLSTVAQVQVAEWNGEETRFIPGMYMKDGKAALYFSDNEYGYGYDITTASIYDFDFNLIKSFSFSKGGTYQLVESRQQTGTTNKDIAYFYARGTVPSTFHTTTDMQNRITDFAEYILNQSLAYEPDQTVENYMADFVRNDTLFVITLTEPQYSYTIERGLYLAPSNNWGNYNRAYVDNLPVYGGEWNTSKIEYDDRNLVIARCYDVDKLNDWDEGLFLPFSQTFFNNDEKFEYVRYKYDLAEGGHSSGGGNLIIIGSENPFGITFSDRDGDGIQDYKSTTFGMHYKGIEIVNEDGNVLYTFDSPIGICDGIKVNLYRSQDNILAEIDYISEDYDASKCIFYRIDCQSGDVRKIKETSSLKTSPNPAYNGEPISIELPYSEKDRIIEVSSSAGQVIKRINLHAGEQHITIRTGDMNSGLYVLSSIEDGRVTCSTKLIVK